MFEGAAEDIGDDFHIAVGVHAEAFSGHDEVIINDAERAEAHPIGVVIIGEAERMVGIEPAVLGVAAFMGFTDDDHGLKEHWFGGFG